MHTIILAIHKKAKSSRLIECNRMKAKTNMGPSMMLDNMRVHNIKSSKVEKTTPQFTERMRLETSTLLDSVSIITPQ